MTNPFVAYRTAAAGDEPTDVETLLDQVELYLHEVTSDLHNLSDPQVNQIDSHMDELCRVESKLVRLKELLESEGRDPRQIDTSPDHWRYSAMCYMLPSLLHAKIRARDEEATPGMLKQVRDRIRRHFEAMTGETDTPQFRIQY